MMKSTAMRSALGRQPRVLVLSKWYPTPEAPNDYPFIRDWARTSARVGDIRVLHMRVERDGVPTPPVCRRVTDVSVAQGLRVWSLNMCHGGRGLAGQLYAEVAALDRVLRGWRGQEGWEPDLLHVHVLTCALHACATRLRRGVPYVVSEHFRIVAQAEIRWFHRIQAGLGYRFASRVMPVSTALATAISSQRLGGSLQVVPNPVAVSVPLRSVEDRRPKIVCVTRLEVHKGVDVLLEAVTQLPPYLDHIDIDIIGEGSCRVDLLALRDRLGLSKRVAFLGHLPRDAVLQSLSMASLAVVPSRVETFSMAAAESIACGTPVVVTRCGGPEDFVDASVGATVPVEDPAALAEAIVRVLDARLAYEPQSLRSAVEARFGEGAVARQLAEIYGDAVSTNRRARPSAPR